MTDAGPATLVVAVPDEAATARLAEDIATALLPGDIVALTGNFGAGKSALARAAIRALADDPDLSVPSPTFALRIDYPLVRFAVTHADLYRLAGDRDQVVVSDVLGGVLPCKLARRRRIHFQDDKSAVPFDDLVGRGQQLLLIRGAEDLQRACLAHSVSPVPIPWPQRFALESSPLRDSPASGLRIGISIRIFAQPASG